MPEYYKLYKIEYQVTDEGVGSPETTSVLIAATSLMLACQYLEAQVPEALIFAAYHYTTTTTFAGVALPCPK